MKTFGDRLKFLRANTSQGALAEAIGIPQTTISNYERCRNEPDFKTIRLMCSHFGVNPEWVMFGTGPMRPGEALQTLELQANAPETPPEAAGTCPRCAKLEAELEREREERRELNAENRQLWKENKELAHEIGELKTEVAVQREQLKSLSGRNVAIDCA